MTKRVQLLVVLVIFLCGRNGLPVATASECRRLSPCRCEFDDDGRGYDLSQVVEKSDHYLETVDPANGDHYYFSPCVDVKLMPQNATSGNDCVQGDGYALCRYNNGSYTKLGTIRDSSFRSSENDHQYLVFKQNNTVTTFQLICTMHSDKSYIFIQSQLLGALDSTNETNLLLFSPYACPITIEQVSHTGFGKVLLILLFVGTFTYFTIGSIVRFAYLGARGIEVIPNLRFWKDLPGLVRDGARFLQNGCRVEPGGGGNRAPDPDSYDAI